MTVGYGAGGGFPFEFSIPDGDSSDTGFLKLFVSTNQVDFGWVAQLAPLDPKYKIRLGARQVPETGVWDAWVAAITVDAE